MPQFFYAAMNKAGNIVSGVQEAPNESAAISAIQSQGFIITQLTSAVSPGQVLSKQKRKKRKRVKFEDIHFFIGQTAELLDAGVPLLRSLEIISSLVPSQQFADVIKEITTSVRGGSTFRDSIARHPKYFPSYWPFIIEVGESSGNLSHILHELARSIEAKHSLESKIKLALIYPCILVTAAVCVIAVFMLKVIPVFAGIFESFNAELPALTQGVLTLSFWMRRYFVLLILVMALMFYFVKRYFSTTKGKEVRDSMILKLPIFGEVVHEVVHARINMLLSLLVNSGLNLIKSLEIVSQACGNRVYEAAMARVSLAVQQGETLANAMRSEPLFSTMMVQLVMIGEESGKMPNMLDRCSLYFENRVNIFAARLSVIIEPLVLSFVGLLVGTIVIAMFMPIFTLPTVIH